MIGEGFREWFEAHSYEEGVGVDGGSQGNALQKMTKNNELRSKIQGSIR